MLLLLVRTIILFDNKSNNKVEQLTVKTMFVELLNRTRYLYHRMKMKCLWSKRILSRFSQFHNWTKHSSFNYAYSDRMTRWIFYYETKLSVSEYYFVFSDKKDKRVQRLSSLRASRFFQENRLKEWISWKIIPLKSSRWKILYEGEIGVRSIWHSVVSRMRRSRSFVCFAYILPFHCVTIKRTNHERTGLFTDTCSYSSATFTRDCELRREAKWSRTSAQWLLQNLPRACCVVRWPTFPNRSIAFLSRWIFLENGILSLSSFVFSLHFSTSFRRFTRKNFQSIRKIKST